MRYSRSEERVEFVAEKMKMKMKFLNENENENARDRETTPPINVERNQKILLF